MESAEIRRRWLRFFESRDHVAVPSAPLVSNDPTTLFTIAGMQPFMPFFLGQQSPPWQRATSVQKCVRFLDIEEVGKTTRHASFFQMCGNFSFGDYFKERAIPLAWELLTTPVEADGYGLDPNRLWVTVYQDDAESVEIWQRSVGLPADRIQRRGMADNFWSVGVPGPCGPCSEIYYDRGPAYGNDGGPIADEERFLEVWNLVFMQYVRGEGPGKEGYPILGELPARNIDTGLGLERLATILQGVDNLYEIDTSRVILDRASELSGQQYGADHESDVALRIVADHVRSATMLIADGVTPSNEGRGYVLRRVLRRAVRNMRLLGAHQPTMHELVDATVQAMGPQYPELVAQHARLATVVGAEETSFLETLRAGTQIFDLAAQQVRDRGQRTLPGTVAFQLHDTHGFPIDLTLEMAAEQGLAVDEAGFRQLMEDQRSRAREDAREKKSGGVDTSAYQALREKTGPSEFIGYATVVGDSTVRGLLREGALTDTAGEGDEVEIALGRTPFYAQGGGQLADQGRIRAGEALLEVVDVQPQLGDLIVHRARVTRGLVRVGAPAYAEVDVERRRAISRAHTATHLVHAGFRRALGESATQAGSENAPGRFRFDFHSPTAVPESVLADVEAEVNAVLLDDIDVHAFVTSLDQAREIGAVALFNEKYGDRVRVVEVGDYSRELCGGTHAARSGQLGVITLLGEASIGSGLRRVEALVGADAYRFLAREHVIVSRVAEMLKTAPDQLPDRIGALMQRLRDAERDVDRMRGDAALQIAPQLAAAAVDVDGALLVAHAAPDGTGSDDLRKLALDVRSKLPADRPAVIAVGSVTDSRPSVVVAVNDLAQERGILAGDLVKDVAALLGGRGGGRGDVAQGGGTQPEALGGALGAVRDLVAQRVARKG
ncbi:MAG: alanyl-tRNA synthetase [Frankiales bacterium]|jgi:alanyl-tRNA synthetase|nr:alanyl-tRNA synthetase [Frankiales bacterium]